MVNYCFVSEANYPNYVDRVKKYTIKRYLELNIDIPYYISTNLKDEFKEFENHPFIKIFDINELRNHESLQYEILPADPTGIYPRGYPWNIRRFIIRKAVEDGYDGIIALDIDTIVKEHINKDMVYSHLNHIYEKNTVQTSCCIYRYDPKNSLFGYHVQYMNDLKIHFEDEQMNTLDGPIQLYFGDKESLTLFLDNWDFLTYYGYKNNGYTNSYLSNISFAIPMSNFKLKHNDTPFYTHHFNEDRY
jgi:hypothetical protein